MTEQEQRAAVVKEALSWIQTPFRWEGCVKGVGVDCGRLPAAVFTALGLKSIDIAALPRLSPQWFLHIAPAAGHPAECECAMCAPYLNLIKRYAAEYTLAPGQIPQPGDIVVVKEKRDWAHSAIVIAWPRVVGAAYGSCVMEWPNIYLSPQYQHRPLKYLNPWGTA